MGEGSTPSLQACSQREARQNRERCWGLGKANATIRGVGMEQASEKFTAFRDTWPHLFVPSTKKQARSQGTAWLCSRKGPHSLLLCLFMERGES